MNIGDFFLPAIMRIAGFLIKTLVETIVRMCASQIFPTSDESDRSAERNVPAPEKSEMRTVRIMKSPK